MKLSDYFIPAPLLLSIIPTAHALVGSVWSVTNVSSTGLTDITFPITIVEADHIYGYYFAQQFNFVGVSEIGYTGIQPRADNGGEAVLHGVFSSFVPGSTTSDANCHSGADEAEGVSCLVNWNGVYGRQYNFEVKTAGDRLWVGTAVDTVTGERIHIGSYTLPEGSQGIKNNQLGFVEWLGAKNCTGLPYQKTVFGDPTTTNAGSVGNQGLSYQYGDCVGKTDFHTEKVTGGVENNCGFQGQSR